MAAAPVTGGRFIASKWVWQQYLGDCFDDPPAQAIPVRQPAKGLPPSWLGCGDADPLLADACVAGDMDKAGVRNALRIFPGLPHALPISTTSAKARQRLSKRRLLSCGPSST